MVPAYALFEVLQAVTARRWLVRDMALDWGGVSLGAALIAWQSAWAGAGLLTVAAAGYLWRGRNARNS